jgi:hypothetical protein
MIAAAVAADSTKFNFSFAVLTHATDENSPQTDCHRHFESVHQISRLVVAGTVAQFVAVDRKR